MSELPAGTVTFLFTDIEGSTRLLKQLRDGYADALAVHQRLLRDAFAAHGGREVDNQGDSFFVVFRRAKDAVAAAVAAQRALHEHPWPEGAAVRVRMGIHTGEATLAGDRLLGLAVHRAARIGATAHGGQILVSQITHDLLHDEEAELPGVDIRDLGEQRLKDLERPARVYQIVARGLPADFPPLNATERPGTDAATGARRVLDGGGRPRSRGRIVIAAAATLAVIAAVAVAVAVAARGEDPPPLVAGSLAQLDPLTGAVREVYPLGGGDVGNIVVSDTSIWVAKERDGTLWRLHTGSGRATPMGLSASTAVSAGEGRLWVPLRNPTRVALVGPGMRVVRSVRIGAPVAEPVVYGGGALWVLVPAASEGRGDPGPEWSAVALRIDPKSGQVRWRARVGFTAWSAAYGFDALWVTNYRDDRLTRVDALSRAVDGRDLQFGPERIVVGRDAIWISHYSAETIVRVDPTSLETEDVLELQEPAPDFAVDERSVWVAQPERKRLLRYDARDGRLEATVSLSEQPWSVELAHGALWVTVGRTD